MYFLNFLFSHFLILIFSYSHILTLLLRHMQIRVFP